MGGHIQIRAMTSSERKQLESIPESIWQILREEVALYFGPWVGVVLAFIFLWGLLSWIGRVLLDTKFGMDSNWAPTIWTWGIAFCTCWLAYYLIREIYTKRNSYQSIAADLQANKVSVYQLELIDVKRFQEPEHGGLIYFLLTDEHKVFVLFDYESQDLGVDRLNPLNSAFQPCSRLTIVKAPVSEITLSQQFSSSPLELSPPGELKVKPDLWPAFNEYCEIPWAELEKTYAA